MLSKHPLVAFLTLLFLAWLIAHFLLSKPPEAQIERQMEQQMAIIQRNSLLPVSPLCFPEYKIYGSLLSDIVECESGGRHNVWGDKGMAYGIAQFWENTFFWLADLAEIKNPDWYNKKQQLYLLDWAIKNGYSYLWTCAK